MNTEALQFLIIFCVGVCFSAFIFYGPMEHGSRCLPYRQRVPAMQQRDAHIQKQLLANEVEMLELKIKRQALEKQLEPRLF